MPRVAPAIPEESALLCEKCGYIVNGIATDSLCPECASPIAESLPEKRQPPLWERRDRPGPIRFIATTLQLIFTPAKFFRSINSRANLRSSLSFARWHYLLSSLLFGAAAFIHASWAWPILQIEFRYRMLNQPGASTLIAAIFILCFSVFAYILLVITTNIASRLTAWEAAYRGLRLPRATVQRALHYHSAHYLPVALFTFATIAGYQWLWQYPMIDTYAVRYLYILCAEVIIAAAYLFFTYWAAMKSFMFANG